MGGRKSRWTVPLSHWILTRDTVNCGEKYFLAHSFSPWSQTILEFWLSGDIHFSLFSTLLEKCGLISLYVTDEAIVL